MEYLILPIIQHVAGGLPELSLVDEDYGQLEVIDDDGREMYPITYPAVLIDLEQVDWSELSGKSQMGEARLKIRLIIDCYDDTHSGSGTEGRIIDREDLRKRLHGLLEGFRPTTESSGLTRVESKFYTWNHGIKVYQEVYTCRISEVITPQIGWAGDPPSIRIQLSSSAHETP